MTAHRRGLAGLAAILTTLAVGAPAGAAPAPAATADTPLALVPAHAPIVIHLRGVQRTKDRLTAFSRNAVPDFGPIVAAQFDSFLQSALEGRRLDGLDPNGSVFLAFLEMPTPDIEKPVAALIARVKSYAEFRDGLLTDDERKSVKPDNAGYERAEMRGREVFFVDRQGYAVVTPSKEAATTLSKKQPGLDSRISKRIAAKLLESDVAVYINVLAVQKEFGEQIKAARQFIENAIDAMPAGGQDKQSIDMAKSMIGSMFQLLEDGRGLLLALDFRPEGINFHLQAHVGPDTKVNELLKDQRPAKLDALGTLPGGQTTYTAAEFGPRVLRAFAPLMYGLGGEGTSAKAAEAALDQLIAANNSLNLASANFPAAGLNVMTFDDPAKATAAHLKLFRALGDGGTFQSAALKGKPEVKENAERHKGFTLHFVRAVWDLDKMADAVPGAGEAVKGAIKKLMGEEMKVWFGTDGRRVLSVTAKDWPAAQAQIDQYLDGRATLATESAFAATRRQLPAETTMVMLADAGPYTQAMADYMVNILKAIPAMPFNLPNEVKRVPTKTAYLGMALTLQAEHGSFDVYVPVTGIQEMRKVLLPLFLGGAE